MPDWFVHAVGLSGTAMILSAYCALQTGHMAAETLVYNYLNLVGAVLILVSLYFHFNLASFVIEIFWIAASILGLVRVYRARRAGADSA